CSARVPLIQPRRVCTGTPMYCAMASSDKPRSACHCFSSIGVIVSSPKDKPGVNRAGVVGLLVLPCHKFLGLIPENSFRLSVQINGIRHGFLFPYRILPDRCSVPVPITRLAWWKVHD